MWYCVAEALFAAAPPASTAAIANGTDQRFMATLLLCRRFQPCARCGFPEAPVPEWRPVRWTPRKAYTVHMRRWALTIALDPRREQPLFLQLAHAIAEDIRRGRLKPGDALPGSRELADLLGINRNTVVAGYGELAAEGLLCTRVGGGTFVAQAPAAVSRSNAPSSEFP